MESAQPSTDPESASPYAIALFNIECSASMPAMQRILEQHRDSIRLVVTTERYGEKHGSFFKQAIDNYRRSGFRFLLYLGYSFVTCFVVLRAKQILAAITGRPVRQKTIGAICGELGIAHLRAPDINHDSVVERLKSENIDLITMFYFDQIVHDEIIGLPEHGVVNFHPAILPECRGLFPVIFSAVENDRRFGITAHDVPDRGIDTGKILGQVHVSSGAERSILKIERLINLAGADLFTEIVSNLPLRREQARLQDESLANYHSYPSRQQIRELGKLGFQIAGMRAFWHSQKVTVDHPSQAD